MTVRMQYVFTGSVQGVGFRFRAWRAARVLDLTGWVQNDSDGRVTMNVQGEKRKIDAMLVMVEKSRYIDVENIKSEELPTLSEEHSFEIRD